MLMVILVVIDEEKSPRGVRGFMLDTGDFGEWRVQGKVGGYTKFVAPVPGYPLSPLIKT